MVAGFIVLVVIVVFVRSRVSHHHRRGVELGADQAQRQPMTEWSARYTPRPKRRGRPRGQGWGF